MAGSCGGPPNDDRSHGPALEPVLVGSFSDGVSGPHTLEHIEQSRGATLAN